MNIAIIIMIININFALKVVVYDGGNYFFTHNKYSLVDRRCSFGLSPFHTDIITQKSCP